MKHVLVIILILSNALAVVAQEQIQTERLNLNANADIIKKGSWQVESGIQFEGTAHESFGLYKLTSPCIHQRYGLSNRIELRLTTAMSSNFTLNRNSFGSNYYINGFVAPHIGAKLLLLKRKKWLPAIAVLHQTGFRPFASKVYRSSRVVPNLDILFSHKMGSQLELGYNVGSYWDDFFSYTYDIYLQKKWGKSILTNIEFDGQWSKPNEMRRNKNNRLFASAGFYLSDRVLADVGYGKSLFGDPDYFFKAGISFALK